MADKYQCFADLNRVERIGVDFQIICRLGRRPAAVIAPHGGWIEPATSEIADAIAGNDLNFYCFEGLKRQRNGDLHITSAHFDEPQCLALVSKCDHVVTVHGCTGAEAKAFLGGRDADLRDAICDQLKVAGFRTDQHADPNLQGVNQGNICNRGRRRRGVQLELSRGLRTQLTSSDEELSAFATAVRTALKAANRE